MKGKRLSFQPSRLGTKEIRTLRNEEADASSPPLPPSMGLVAYVHKKPVSMSLSAETMALDDTIPTLLRLAPELMVSAGTPRIYVAFQYVSFVALFRI